MYEQAKSTIRAIDQSKLGEEVAQMLRRAILAGELEPGTHLVESSLSTDFGVSRGPIRDALRELESEGLVEARRRGVFVTGLTRDDVWELYTLRAAIDVVALDLAAAQFTLEDFTRLRRLVEVMERAADDGRMADFAEADIRFHSAFYERAGHRRLLRVWQSFVGTFQVLIELGSRARRRGGAQGAARQEPRSRARDLPAAAPREGALDRNIVAPVGSARSRTCR